MILIIDDEEQLRKLLSRIIALEGFPVLEAATLKASLQVLNHHDIDVVLCDVKLPDGNGVEFVPIIKQKFPLVEVILLTAFGNISDGVQSIKNGAFDYLVKGNDNDRIIPLLAQAAEKAKQAKVASVRINHKNISDFHAIIGESDVIKQAIRLARKASGTDVNVLLLGETGTGKEVFANAIHHNSKRAEKPIVAINCSAFTRDLLESELFGHKAGAFTGAMKDKKGLIEVADGGTLFLDEIGELNIELQAKLLRVLENGEFFRLGDTKKQHVDVRLIAATNRDLREEISKGTFREDLYYRLNVFTIVLPALRERTEDLPLLIRHFLAQFAEQEGKSSLQIDALAMQHLKAYSWKGNIRELKNTLERAVILVDNNEITTADLPYEVQRRFSTDEAPLSLAAIEKEHIFKILNSTNGNKAKAARVLEIGIATLYRKMQEYGI